jgi:tetratricopeptide (TPR) repeat protein
MAFGMSSSSLIAATEQDKTRGRHREGFSVQFLTMALNRILMTFLTVFALLFVFESTQAQPEIKPAAPSAESPPASAPTSAPETVHELAQGTSQVIKTPQESFQSGLLAYQNKNYQQAMTDFEESLKSSPSNAAALTNLGLAAFQLGKKAWAIAYFRKALALSPGLTTAQQGLDFALSQTDIKEIPHQIETYELVREKLLEPVSEFSYFWILAFLMFLFGWSLLQYLGRRKKALQEDTPAPTFPWISVVSGFFSVVFLMLGLMKVYDLQIPRATVVEEKVAAQSAPGENQLNLFDLYGGFEVIVRNHSGDWVQVTYPGALTGWIKKNSLYVTSGGSPW